MKHRVPTRSEERALTAFFKARQYAVVGASADRAKFGNKVLRWYMARPFTVTPVHPSQKSIEGLAACQDLQDVILQASTPSESLVSVSMITPPSISLSVLQNFAANPKTQAFWLQPGAADASVGTSSEDNLSAMDSRPARKYPGQNCVLRQLHFDGR